MTYYIRHRDNYYRLNATEDISVTYSGQTTKHPTQDKKTKSDNYVLDNPRASYSGYVTDVQTPTSHNKLSAGDYIRKLEAAMNSKEPLFFKHKLDGEEEGNWFITSLNATQNNTHGFGGIDSSGSVVQAFKISISLERIDISSAIDVSLVIDSRYSDDLQEEKTSSGATSSFDEKEKPKETFESVSMIAKAGEALGKAEIYEGNL